MLRLVALLGLPLAVLTGCVVGIGHRAHHHDHAIDSARFASAVGRDCTLYHESGAIEGRIMEVDGEWIILTDPSGGEHWLNIHAIDRIDYHR